MQRVLVIGGRGFLGRRVVDLLARAGHQAVAGSRRDGIDLGEPGSFAAFDGYHAVVDCADAGRAPPDAALAWCVAHGKLFVETSADTPVLERLLAATPEGPGLAVIGVGLFPGLSNLLGREVWRRAGDRGRLDLGVRLRVLSGAGRATRGLMGTLLGEPARAWRAGEPIDLPPLTPGPRLRFAGRERATLALRLAEPAMLRASTGIADVAAYAAAVPLLRLALGGRWRRRLLLPLGRVGLAVLRGGLFRWRRGHIELAAAAGDHHACLVAPDGFATTASAVAATVGLLAGRTATGLATPDQLLGLDQTLAAMAALDPASVPRVG